MQRPPEQIQDELLVLRCQDGEPDAFKRLVARWNMRLRGLVVRLTGNRDAAADLLQDVWLAIVGGLSRLEDPARFRVWAYRIAAHKCADWVRRRGVRREAAKVLQAEAVAAEAGEPRVETGPADELVRLRAAVRRLPEELRTTISLHYLDGLSVAEVAGVLGVPGGTVKSRLHSARELLKRALLEDGHERPG
jgi:RNA polymerase sigma-70 factor (ECF subfamily)